MKHKKWLALLLALLLLVCATACNKTSHGDDRNREDKVASNVSPTKSKQTKPTTINQTNLTDSSIYEETSDGPLLYRVTDTDGDVVWLFGSIHIGEEDFYPLPDYVIDALEDSDGLAVEFDIVDFEEDITAQTRALRKLIYTDGSTIEDHLSEEVYEQAVDVLTDLGIYMSAYDVYMPALWSSLIDSSLLDAEAASLGVDRHMIEMAYDLDLPVIDIESANLQYGMMASYSEDLQEMLLMASIDSANNREAFQAEVQQLVDMWQEGDAQALRTYLSSEADGLSKEEQKLYEEYNTKMRTERDEDMTDFVIDALDDGEELFVCVGAAHVVGTDGIIDRLLTDGYTVELVD